jgi:thiol:disulfide interchange protein
MGRLLDLVWLLLAFDPASLRRQAATLAVSGIAVLLLVATAYGALLYALAVWLSERLGDLGASLAIAGGATLLALVILLIARARLNHERRQNHMLAESRRLSLLAVFSAMPHLRSARLSALLAGFALGRTVGKKGSSRKKEDAG